MASVAFGERRIMEPCVKKMWFQIVVGSPQDSCTSWYSRPYVIPSQECGLLMNSGGISLLIWSYKKLWLPSCSPSVALSLACSEGSQLPCCELPYRETRVARNRECLPPTVSWQPSVYQPSRNWTPPTSIGVGLKEDTTSVEPPDKTAALAGTGAFCRKRREKECWVMCFTSSWNLNSFCEVDVGISIV